MIKSIEVNVPKQTSVILPVQKVIKLCDGFISSVTFRPPPGPNYEVYAKIRYREFSLVPLSELDWIPLEKYPVMFPLNWNDWDGTYDLLLEFCSPGARYEHNIVVEIIVEENATTQQLFREFIDKGL